MSEVKIIRTIRPGVLEISVENSLDPINTIFESVGKFYKNKIDKNTVFQRKESYNSWWIHSTNKKSKNCYLGIVNIRFTNKSRYYNLEFYSFQEEPDKLTKMFKRYFNKKLRC